MSLMGQIASHLKLGEVSSFCALVEGKLQGIDLL